MGFKTRDSSFGYRLPLPVVDQTTARRFTLALFAAALVIPLAFAFYTGHLWEDFFITFRISQNLVAGNGLVFQPGERVHTFTSPLGTLLPAACSAIFGGRNDPAAIWLFRIVCCAFLASAIVLLVRAAIEWGFGKFGAGVLL